MYWYLSFADPNKPKGKQWLGGAVIEAASFPEAHLRSHALKLNPGGELRAWPMGGTVPPEFLDRLLSMDDLRRMDLANGGAGEVERV